MGKNKKKHYKPSNKAMMGYALDYIHDRIVKNLPYVYSAIALAMWNVLDETDDEKHEDIMTLINESMVVWNDIVENGKDVVEECEKVTGISMRDAVC